MKKRGIYLILHNIRSGHNVGSIFRTADAAGVSKIFLTGYTPAPTDRFGRVQKEVAKAALGAESFVLWERRANVKVLLRKLQKENIFCVAVEQDARAVDYKKIEARQKMAFLFGNEVSGVPRTLCGECDVIAQIPMLGKKESLNVNVAAGIALFRILDV